MLMEEALIFQHLSRYLQIIFMRNFQRCSVFSLISEWHRVVTNQSVNKKLKNLAVSCVETGCCSVFVSKMKFSFLVLILFSVIIQCLAKFIQ